MNFDLKDLPTTGVWMTPSQFESIMEGQKCGHCDQKSKWLPKYERGFGYCDEHFPFPYKEEKLKEEQDG